MDSPHIRAEQVPCSPVHFASRAIREVNDKTVLLCAQCEEMPPCSPQQADAAGSSQGKPWSLSASCINLAATPSRLDGVASPITRSTPPGAGAASSIPHGKSPGWCVCAYTCLHSVRSGVVERCCLITVVALAHAQMLLAHAHGHNPFGIWVPAGASARRPLFSETKGRRPDGTVGRARYFHAADVLQAKGLGYINVANFAVHCLLGFPCIQCEIGTGISEASKRVPIFLHDVRGGK